MTILQVIYLLAIVSCAVSCSSRRSQIVIGAKTAEGKLETLSVPQPNSPSFSWDETLDSFDKSMKCRGRCHIGCLRPNLLPRVTLPFSRKFVQSWTSPRAGLCCRSGRSRAITNTVLQLGLRC